MARLHMQFKNVHKATRRAAKTLFDSKPWQGSDEDKQSKFERFLREAAAVYGVPQPSLSIVTGSEVVGLVSPNTIVLDKYSVTSLFNAFRQHMQYTGAVDVEFLDRRDAQAWACSLFYMIRPILFRKRVREGRIMGVTPNDLLTSASLLARQDEVDEAFAGIVATSYDSDDDIEPEDEDAAEEAVEASSLSLVDMTVAEAADHLGVSQSTVRNMINDGRLAAVRDGRRITVRVEVRS